MGRLGRIAFLGTGAFGVPLLARIAEDEHWARLADDVTDKVEDDWQDVTQPITHAMTQDRPQEQWIKKYGYAYGHIARQDPARVLAECEAKRLVVGLHGDGEPNCMGGYVEGLTHRQIIETESYNGVATGYCDTLRALALPYADHPDYRDAWRP